MNRPLDTCMEQLRQDVFAFTPVLVDYRFQVLGRTLARWYTCFSHLVWSPLDGFVANEPSLRNRAFFLSCPRSHGDNFYRHFRTLPNLPLYQSHGDQISRTYTRYDSENGAVTEQF